jgi:hypothetical protein
MRQGYLVLLRHDRVAPVFREFGHVPEPRPVTSPLGFPRLYVPWQEDLGVRDVGTLTVVMEFAGALIADALAGTVGRGQALNGRRRERSWAWPGGTCPRAQRSTWTRRHVVDDANFR